jgi:hypothetical protein
MRVTHKAESVTLVQSSPELLAGRFSLLSASELKRQYLVSELSAAMCNSACVFVSQALFGGSVVPARGRERPRHADREVMAANQPARFDGAQYGAAGGIQIERSGSLRGSELRQHLGAAAARRSDCSYPRRRSAVAAWSTI